MRAAVVLAAMLVGCIHSPDGSRSRSQHDGSVAFGERSPEQSKRCSRLSDGAVYWTASGIGAGTVAAGFGAGVIPAKSDRQEAAFAITAATAAAFSTAAIYIGNDRHSKYIGEGCAR